MDRCLLLVLLLLGCYFRGAARLVFFFVWAVASYGKTWCGVAWIMSEMLFLDGCCILYLMMTGAS